MMENGGARVEPCHHGLKKPTRHECKHDRRARYGFLRRCLPSPQLNSRYMLILFFCCYITLSTAAKHNVYIKEGMIIPLNAVARDTADFQGLVVDQRPPMYDWMSAVKDKRQDFEENQDPRPSSSYSVSSSAEVTITSAATLPTSTGEQSNVASTTSAAPSDLPTPLDAGYAANTSERCSSFIRGFLDNPEFQSCLPISILLQNSHSFFQASKSLVSISQVLDSSCKANATECARLMRSLASKITSSSACARDLASENSAIIGVVEGLRAYQVLYSATCLKNPKSSAYCYAEAITNSDNPTDAYIYYLPLNTSLPSGGQPTCGSCTQDVMGVFKSGTSSRSASIARTYQSAAVQVNIQCGPNFVDSNMAQVRSLGISHSRNIFLGHGSVMVLVLAIGSWLLR